MTILIPISIPNSVRGFIDKKTQIQAAGIDLTVQDIEEFTGPSLLATENSNRVLPETNSVELNGDNVFELEPGAYQLRYNESIHVPLNAAAIVLPRSSLMRSGATIHSALWDPGYDGVGMGLLTVYRKMKIEKNARVAQIVFFKLDQKVSTGYDGIYQKEGLDK